MLLIVLDSIYFRLAEPQIIDDLSFKLDVILGLDPRIHNPSNDGSPGRARG
ncbi:hypothetical protein AGR3A_Cc410033 [Agrobacterium tomkonis CFBP 6623]|uniref:Uncharacterized protein n=1 Tax=Agrobacterium tomkonis CFBP 6623 TaxID=1183432 RepID=A0A1S7Q6E5_9HYPH|nr:hypothetical protein AGR3A_Cc410033 [Agrobacterium tomkonis CFBP 6623]